jgi:hypothetical protein
MSTTKTVSSKRKEKLIEQHRYINVDYGSWYRDVEYEFTQDMKEIGIQVYRCYFSGFWSQGDGACFDGQINNLMVYLDKHHPDKFPMIRKLREYDYMVTAGCEHEGSYYHEYCTRFWVNHSLFTDVMPCPTEFHLSVAEAFDAQLEGEVEEFDTAVTEVFRGYMRELYGRLEEEYTYLTSDEAVWDAIEANELDEDDEDEEDEAA